MTIGLIGRKVGMTRIFSEDGESIPVSVVEVFPNCISQIKSEKTDEYNAIQLTSGEEKNLNRVNKPLRGHLAKAQVAAGAFNEFRMESIDGFELGQTFSVAEVFQPEQYVDVRGTSKGKGFAGGVKRHNFRTQDATHGNSRSHRVLGSIGQNQTPGKVFKGKKMAGHLGNVRTTVQNLKLIRVDAERNLLLIKGAIPGFPGARVVVMPAVKKKAGG